jgi:hypothetical protein
MNDSSTLTDHIIRTSFGLIAPQSLLLSQPSINSFIYFVSERAFEGLYLLCCNHARYFLTAFSISKNVKNFQITLSILIDNDEN